LHFLSSLDFLKTTVPDLSQTWKNLYLKIKYGINDGTKQLKTILNIKVRFTLKPIKTTTLTTTKNKKPL